MRWVVELALHTEGALSCARGCRPGAMEGRPSMREIAYYIMRASTDQASYDGVVPTCGDLVLDTSEYFETRTNPNRYNKNMLEHKIKFVRAVP